MRAHTHARARALHEILNQLSSLARTLGVRARVLMFA
jgi:hypothetical protein